MDTLRAALLGRIVKFFTKCLHDKKGLANISGDVSSVAYIDRPFDFRKLMAKPFASNEFHASFAAVGRRMCRRAGYLFHVRRFS